MESLGPVPGSKLYLDMHSDEQLCWGYTAIMVLVQVLVFGRVQDNRGARRLAKAAKLEERERIKAEKMERLEEERRLALQEGNGYTTGAANKREVPTKPNGFSNGHVRELEVAIEDTKLEEESEDSSSIVETSEEEMII